MILTYDIDENMSRGSVNMRDSGFSLNNYVKKGKKKLISFWRVGGLLLTVIDANIGYRREHDMSEREYSGFGIFNLKFKKNFFI